MKYQNTISIRHTTFYIEDNTIIVIELDNFLELSKRDKNKLMEYITITENTSLLIVKDIVDIIAYYITLGNTPVLFDSIIF